MLRPLPAEEWTPAAAAHLLNRAGFGGPPAAVAALAALNHEAALDRLLSGSGREAPPPDEPWTRLDPDRAGRLRKLRGAGPDERRELLRRRRRAERIQVTAMRQWWLDRMVRAEDALTEKLTLFWHGHFATSVVKVREPWLMWRQNRLFRTLGAGSWPALLLAVARDPAMLLWLDQARSRAEHPNENFARELLELFTLGEGNYSERDVTEAARALTGLSLSPARLEPAFRPRFHDDGEKEFLGVAGRLGVEDVVRAIVARPGADAFISGKLWAFFAGGRPGPALGEALAAEFRRCGREIGPFLRVLFRCGEFYGPDVAGAQIKSPAQLFATACRQLERAAPPAPLPAVALNALGQDLFAPPSVKGWEEGAGWISANSLLARHNLMRLLVDGDNVFPAPAGPFAPPGGGAPSKVGGADPGRWFTEAERGRPESLVAAIERRFFPRPLRPATRRALLDYLGAGGAPNDSAVRAAVRLALCAPEYQLA